MMATIRLFISEATLLKKVMLISIVCCLEVKNISISNDDGHA